MLRIKVLLTLSFLFFSSLMFLSCDLISDPERYIEKSVVTPSQGILQFDELVPGQHIDGTLRFSIDTTGLGFKITGIGVFIDGQEITRYQNNNYIVTIDTRNRSEGLHTIGIGFYKENPNHGVVNLFFTPSIYLETELVFDRTLPAVIPITCSDEENGYTRISWNESPNENFVKYEVLKSYNGMSWQTISTINSRSTTSVIDSVDIVLNGIEVDYKLLHYTGFTFEKSNTVNYIVGDKIIYDMQTDISKRGLVANPSLNEVYFMIDRKIVSFSSIDNSLKREILLPDIPNGPPFASFAVSDDGQRIYVYNNYGRKLYILNANSLTTIVSKRLNVPEELRTDSDEIIPIDQDKFLLFGKYDKIRLVNFSQNILLDSLVVLNSVIHSVTVSPDKSKLFISISESNQFKIQIRDINTPGFQLISETITPISSNQIKTTPDGQKLIELPSESTKLNIRDINSLDVVATIYPEPNRRFLYFKVDDSKIYMSQNCEVIFNGESKSAYKIIHYNLNTLNLESFNYFTNSWYYNLDFSGNNLYMPTISFLDQKNVIGLSIKK